MRKMTVSEIQKMLGFEVEIVAEEQRRKLAEIPVGETCEIAGYEFIVLEHDDEGTFALLKDFLVKSQFGDSCDYRTSRILKTLESFDMEIMRKLGADALIRQNIDLTSDDGRKDFGVIQTYSSLLTCDLYRRWVEIIDKFRIDAWWWLATAYSTPSNDYTRFVRCVIRYGVLHGDDCDYAGGVRPFCKFNSSIFVS